jgi:hypothetical protein
MTADPYETLKSSFDRMIFATIRDFERSGLETCDMVGALTLAAHKLLERESVVIVIDRQPNDR